MVTIEEFQKSKKLMTAEEAGLDEQLGTIVYVYMDNWYIWKCSKEKYILLIGIFEYITDENVNLDILERILYNYVKNDCIDARLILEVTSKPHILVPPSPIN